MAFEINQVVISGNLTADPELRSLPSGASLCRLRIAHNSRRKDSGGDWIDVPNYFDVTFWQGLGEWIAKNLGKGAKVVVSGQLQWREWQDKDGNKRQAVDIVGRDISTPPRGDGGRQQSAPASAEDFTPRGGDGFTPRDVPDAGRTADGRQVDDDIPF